MTFKGSYLCSYMIYLIFFTLQRTIFERKSQCFRFSCGSFSTFKAAIGFHSSLYIMEITMNRQAILFLVSAKLQN